MTHALITVLLSVAFCLFDWDAGLSIAVAAFFMGREHAQAEYRWIERYGGHKRANMPWWGGFDPHVWNTQSIVDWLVPLLIAALFAIFN